MPLFEIDAGRLLPIQHKTFQEVEIKENVNSIESAD